MKNALYIAVTKISPDDINVPRVDEDAAVTLAVHDLLGVEGALSLRH